MLARYKKRSTNNKKIKNLTEKEGALSHDKIEIGYFVSTDHFFLNTPCSLCTGYGREPSDCSFQGGTICNDASSILVWVENQVSLGSNNTVMGKSRFDKWLRDQAAAEVYYYDGDNSIFTTT